MRSPLCFALLLGLVSTLECPPHYDIMEGRCIRMLALDSVRIIIDDELPKYREECGKDNAHLPIIKNDEENEIFDNIMFTLFGQDTGNCLLMDLACNSTTRRLQWADGTIATYVRWDTVDMDFDCVATKQTVVSQPHFDDWIFVPTDKATHSLTPMCVYDGWSPSTAKPTSIPAQIQCADFSPIDIPVDNKPCIKIYTEPLPWSSAQRECAAFFASLLTVNSAEENKYFWRAAISNGILHGMHIGAHLSNNSQWSWDDGDVAIDGKSYDNFASFFPIPGGGDCTSMATENAAAFWVNENCDYNEQPFICRRADFSTIPENCPAVAPKAGEDIFPPGIPNPTIPCEYYLFVDPGKLVELEILTLITDERKDYLEILEGTSGPHLIANLTDIIFTTRKFTTVHSNVMRVNWKPNGSGSGNPSEFATTKSPHDPAHIEISDE